MAKQKTTTEEPLEKQLWKAADKLRKNIDAAEYKHVVLGLIFLKYISDTFEELYARLKAEASQGADPEDRDEYQAENVFFVPQDARWQYLLSKAKLPDIGKTVDDAMDAIEKENSSLKGVLPKVYARQNLDPASLGELIDVISNIALGDVKARSADVLGHVFEYFLGEFALAEGKQGGQFYTPRSVVELLVEMLEPYKGRVFDPCCGSGGMFVQSEKFVVERQGAIHDISIYGQESNQTTWRLSKMNLAIRGIDSLQVKWNNEVSSLNDAHKDLKADYIIANPPFNVSDWGGDLLRNDGRWKYGVPPAGNASFAWMQHFIYHLSPSGRAGVVLAKGALTSKTSGEGEIRKSLIKNGLIDCIVNLPAKLFLNTQIPAALWFIKRPSPPAPLSEGEGRNDEVAFLQNSSASQNQGVHFRGGLFFTGLINEARALRQKQTPAEEMFWQLVKDRKFLNLKFRRQHQIGPYVADFYCNEHKLVIEFDGAVHNSPEQIKHDAKRDKYLTSIGNTVIRFNNNELINTPETVFQRITHFISPASKEENNTPNPSPFGKNDIPNNSLSPLGENDIRSTSSSSLGENNIRSTSPLSLGRGVGGEGYSDILGFCVSVPSERVKELDYVLTPGRYVGLPDDEDDFDFNERFVALKAELEEQFKEEERLNWLIKNNLERMIKP
ncbi:MAG: N-6 DNA methylase [Bacteroidales bacterium]|jgi:type I restriction enzyme M protein|nr:N-6 DNA methylase [Bacteroidales bacterium]